MARMRSEDLAAIVDQIVAKYMESGPYVNDVVTVGPSPREDVVMVELFSGDPGLIHELHARYGDVVSVTVTGDRVIPADKR